MYQMDLTLSQQHIVGHLRSFGLPSPLLNGGHPAAAASSHIVLLNLIKFGWRWSGDSMPSDPNSRCLKLSSRSMAAFSS